MSAAPIHREPVGCLDSKTVGICLLLIVNVLWVLSSELTRFIFVDEEFRRPFFTVYVKSCTLIVYMIRYLLFEAKNDNSYKILISENSVETDYELTCESLAMEGYESVTDVDSDVESIIVDGEKRQRKIRFAGRREIRRMPASNAEDQRRARLPYSQPSIDCQLYLSRHVKYTLFFFAPLWLVCSFTYQAALAFTSVSSLNLISSSSSVFVLAFAICFPSANNKFSAYKALLVLINVAGVLVVSHYIPSLSGAFFALVSALSYAVYLFTYGHFEEKYGRVDINLMFGTIGVIALVVGTPALNLLDTFGVEELHPLPNMTQFSSILFSALIGTIVADYLWLLAVGLCDSLTASLSMTISIPLSFFADTVIRSRAPTLAQLLASIPILLAFVGAAYANEDLPL
ncbi:Protein CBG22233 [Caenorhabditis briggsae]|uniref:Protein CBG22233 n=1 Tax=Caenorhabditis briggsae TaxID=6238 RepID=A8Y1U7_CAEBR|nr:Protein CBG22233 [Caenorhabditis briggsae]CAP38867.2 Protein CBG22233 [Caenorhabditis briggsae]